MCFQFVYTVHWTLFFTTHACFCFYVMELKKRTYFAQGRLHCVLLKKIIFNEYIQTALILFIIKKLFFYFIFYHATLENIFGTLNNSVYIQNIVVWNESL